MGGDALFNSSKNKGHKKSTATFGFTNFLKQYMH